MVRVWFNHWFSTSYRLIELMKEDAKQEIYVLGSNKQADSVIQKVCDEWYPEFESEGEDYIADCLSFCKEHRVDVFVPRRKMVEISKHKEQFTRLGVQVMVDDYDVISLLNDKAKAYEFLSDIPGLHIPEYYIVNTAKQFKEAYETLKEKYTRICMKFVQDEGGMSFRTITESQDRFKRLRVYQGSEVVFGDVMSILSEKDSFDDLMVMPYLEGHEISVDCLNTEDGLIAIPRNKGAARHERVEYDNSIMEMTKAILAKTNLQCPCNVQYKIRAGVPYLLEINTRMSGGLQMSCLAAEVNIPNIALNKLLGTRVQWSQNKEEKIVSYIEIPKIIK